MANARKEKQPGRPRSRLSAWDQASGCFRTGAGPGQDALFGRKTLTELACPISCEPVRLRQTPAGPLYRPARLTCSSAPRIHPRGDRALRGIAPPPSRSCRRHFSRLTQPWAALLAPARSVPLLGAPVATRCATLWWFDSEAGLFRASRRSIAFASPRVSAREGWKHEVAAD